MENISSTMAADSTVRSQDSANSSDSKDTKVSKMSDSTRTSKDSSKPESCLESKHSKEVLIDSRHHHHHQSSRHHHQQDQQNGQIVAGQLQKGKQEPKDDTNKLMFASCGQLLLGLALVVFGILVLANGASLGGSGAGIWAGAGALIAGALGLVATLATSSTGKTASGFSSAHLASSLVALALSNMAAITALAAIVRDAQKPVPDVTLHSLPDEETADIPEGWEGLISSIGLLITSVLELIVSGYTCVNLTPKLCGCLRPSNDDVEEMTIDGKTLKTRNMVHQWVIAQNHVPKNQPIYVVQPVVPMHPMMQPPYGMPASPGKFPAGFLPATHPPGAYVLPPAHMGYPTGHRPSSQMMRGKPQKKRRHSSNQSDSGVESRQQRRSSSGHYQQHRQNSSSPEARKTAPMASIGEDQMDFSRTYTGLDKRISEEFISIAMDPERKSNKASSHHGSDAGANTKH